jgi:hypothetical protein
LKKAMVAVMVAQPPRNHGRDAQKDFCNHPSNGPCEAVVTGD